MDNHCTWCEEPVEAGQQHPAFQDNAMHFECGFRTAVGSVAHLLRRCHCYKLGSDLNDPPGLTKREAARAAERLWRQMVAWYGEEIDSCRTEFIPTSAAQS
jgi:hypothetical protein